MHLLESGISLSARQQDSTFLLISFPIVCFHAAVCYQAARQPEQSWTWASTSPKPAPVVRLHLWRTEGVC